MAGRRKGVPMYGPKKVTRTCILTREADIVIRAAMKRTGKSYSDILEHGARVVAPALTREESDAIAGARGAA